MEPASEAMEPERGRSARSAEPLQPAAPAVAAMEPATAAMESEPKERVVCGTLIEVEGDLLDATEDLIAHQANCVTHRARGLAHSLFSRFPHSDIYSAAARQRRGTLNGDTPGTVAISGELGNHAPRGVAHLFGQRAPGRAWGGEEWQRLAWFRAALEDLGRQPGLTSVAFPERIGCGMAGGDWSAYRAALASFAAEHPQIRAVIYKPARAAA